MATELPLTGLGWQPRRGGKARQAVIWRVRFRRHRQPQCPGRWPGPIPAPVPVLSSRTPRSNAFDLLSSDNPSPSSSTPILTCVALGCGSDTNQTVRMTRGVFQEIAKNLVKVLNIDGHRMSVWKFCSNFSRSPSGVSASARTMAPTAAATLELIAIGLPWRTRARASSRSMCRRIRSACPSISLAVRFRPGVKPLDACRERSRRRSKSVGQVGGPVACPGSFLFPALREGSSLRVPRCCAASSGVGSRLVACG